MYSLTLFNDKLFYNLQSREYRAEEYGLRFTKPNQGRMENKRSCRWGIVDQIGIVVGRCLELDCSPNTRHGKVTRREKEKWQTGANNSSCLEEILLIRLRACIWIWRRNHSQLWSCRRLGEMLKHHRLMSTDFGLCRCSTGVFWTRQCLLKMVSCGSAIDYP